MRQKELFTAQRIHLTFAWSRLDFWLFQWRSFFFWWYGLQSHQGYQWRGCGGGWIMKWTKSLQSLMYPAIFMRAIRTYYTWLKYVPCLIIDSTSLRYPNNTQLDQNRVRYKIENCLKTVGQSINIGIGFSWSKINQGIIQCIYKTVLQRLRHCWRKRYWFEISYQSSATGSEEEDNHPKDPVPAFDQEK